MILHKEKQRESTSFRWQLKVGDGVVMVSFDDKTNHYRRDHFERRSGVYFPERNPYSLDPRQRTMLANFMQDEILAYRAKSSPGSSLYESDPESPRSIVAPPGARIVRVLDFLFSMKTMERLFNPIIADLRFEHAEALAQGRPYKAKWIHVRYVVVLMALACTRMPTWVVRELLSLWRVTGG